MAKMITLQKDGNDLMVSFPYDAETVALIKTMPDRRFDPTSKNWRVPTAHIDLLLKKFPLVRTIGQVPEMQVKKASSKEERKELLASIKPIVDYPFVTTPFAHQVEGFNTILTRKKLLLGDEMGLGKTKQIIDAFGAIKMYKELTPFLVICGINGTKKNWLNEVKVHAGGKINKKSGSVTGGLLSAIIIDGSKAKRLEIIETLLSGAYDMGIVNVESLRNKEILEALKQVGFVGVAFDEVHKCKNGQSQQGKALQEITAEWMIGVTGTPILNRAEEAHNVLKWLGIEKRSYFSFRKDLCIMGGFSGYEVMGYRPEALKILYERIQGNMLRRLESEVLDLPSKLVANAFVDMDADQAKLYRQVKDEIKNEIAGTNLNLSMALTKMLRLRQLTSSPKILGSSIVGAKVEQVKEMLEEIVASGKKAVIFSQWSAMTNILRDELASYKPAYVTGEVANDKREGEVTRFQSVKCSKCGQVFEYGKTHICNGETVEFKNAKWSWANDCMVMIGTIGALGTGWTLTAGSYVIFTDWDWVPANNEQAEKRCHRIGTQEAVKVSYLVVPNTIDEHILEILAEKKETFDMLINGKMTSTEAKAIIDRLLSDN